MTKLLLILMVVGLWSGCGGDSPTGEEEKELLVWTITYDDGNVKEEYQFYREGGRMIKHGYYNGFDVDGKILTEGIYKNGVKDGKWFERGGRYCEIYEGLGPGLPPNTYDYYFSLCSEGIEIVYNKGECVEMCEGDEDKDE